MPLIAKTEVPGFFCSDPEVQEFCEDEVWNFNHRCSSQPALSGPELFEAACHRFGDYRCWDLQYWMN